MAKKDTARAVLSNTVVRRFMLQYFYERNKNATSVMGKKGSAVKISVVKSELKAQHGPFSRNLFCCYITKKLKNRRKLFVTSGSPGTLLLDDGYLEPRSRHPFP